MAMSADGSDVSPTHAVGESDEERARPTPPAADVAAPAERLAALLAELDLASDDTASPAASRPASNDEALRREVPPHHV